MRRTTVCRHRLRHHPGRRTSSGTTKWWRSLSAGQLSSTRRSNWHRAAIIWCFSSAEFGTRWRRSFLCSSTLRCRMIGGREWLESIESFFRHPRGGSTQQRFMEQARSGPTCRWHPFPGPRLTSTNRIDFSRSAERTQFFLDSSICFASSRWYWMYRRSMSERGSIGSSASAFSAFSRSTAFFRHIRA